MFSKNKTVIDFWPNLRYSAQRQGLLASGPLAEESEMSNDLSSFRERWLESMSNLDSCIAEEKQMLDQTKKNSGPEANEHRRWLKYLQMLRLVHYLEIPSIKLAFRLFLDRLRKKKSRKPSSTD